MATITITPEDGRAYSSVTLSEPDEDGEYTWTCTCGTTSDRWEDTADAVASAEVHVDFQCRATA